MEGGWCGIFVILGVGLEAKIWLDRRSLRWTQKVPFSIEFILSFFKNINILHITSLHIKGNITDDHRQLNSSFFILYISISIKQTP